VVKHVIKNPKEESNTVDNTEKESIEEQGGQLPENEDSKSSSAWKRSTSKVEAEEAMSRKYRRKKSNLIISESDRGESICAICLNEYKEQEEICWSQNPDCEHCFHHKCIEIWLARHDECPCCRNSYLVSGDVEPGDVEQALLAQQGRDILENSSSSRDIPLGDQLLWYDIALDYSGALRDAMSFEAYNNNARGLASQERDYSGALRDAMSFEEAYSSHHSSLSTVSLETATSGT
jgi:hypothetical protein